MKLDLIPHSTAANSYDLMLDVIKAIDDEPNRFDWSDWVSDVTHRELDGAFDVKAPACGTQACVGGWITLLTAAVPLVQIAIQPERWFPENALADLSDLFYAEGKFCTAKGADEFDGSICPFANETQREYADRGIAAIRLFMATHETALKAHAIVIPPRAHD